MIDKSQKLYVGNGHITLYTQEDKIVKMTDEIMKKYKGDFNNKDFIKKSIELFHLLTYLSINKNMENIKRISPNEPGDFIVFLKDKNILVEVVTVFGDVEAKKMNDFIKELLGIPIKDPNYSTELPVMDANKLHIQLKKILSNKQDKLYFREYEKTMLLLVTSEHDRCGRIPWYLVENTEENINEFINKTQSSIKTLNYFSSGMVGNPSTNDIINEIELYNDVFN
ncbi:hypothetical protein [Pseudogracilibacillus sp. SO30301A]|uniref:hypothetical protein n=1 Tax=Pseudogracilibacillus sp. SO30301A TaxID=3098291 RepID=UPI00300DC1CD